jgi:hypothetical protein
MRLQQLSPGSGKAGKSRFHPESIAGQNHVRNVKAKEYRARVRRKKDKHKHSMLEEEGL